MIYLGEEKTIDIQYYHDESDTRIIKGYLNNRIIYQILVKICGQPFADNIYVNINTGDSIKSEISIDSNIHIINVDNPYEKVSYNNNILTFNYPGTYQFIFKYKTYISTVNVTVQDIIYTIK